MAYQVHFSRQAFKALAEINEPYYSKIKEAIYNLAINPRPNGYIKLKGKDAYRIRVADYRIIYHVVDTILTIDILNIGHRKDIYE
jgi:mRNA interferase RelE/StbE